MLSQAKIHKPPTDMGQSSRGASLHVTPARCCMLLRSAAIASLVVTVVIGVESSNRKSKAFFAEQTSDAAQYFDLKARNASLLTPRSYLTTIAAQAADKPVEQTRKNIQVLKGLPESQLFLVMNFVGDSLGVHCDYCHVKDVKNPQTGADNWQWERDDKQKKLVGREMMRMVLELNRTKFNREAVVSCYTCHRGSTSVERMAPLPPRDFVKEALQSQKKTLPDTQQIVSKYLSVVGAKQEAALSGAITMKGTVERSSGSTGSVEVIFRQPNKFLVKQTTAQGVLTHGTNGVVGWTQTAKGVTSLTGESLKQLNAFVAQFNPIKIPASLPPAVVSGPVTVNDREAYVVTLQNNSAQPVQMFFEVDSGVLLRSMTWTDTLLGPLNVQSDFSDYRDLNGLKLPSVIRISDVAAFDTVIRRFSEMKIDPAVDENIFDVPRTSSP